LASSKGRHLLDLAPKKRAHLHHLYYKLYRDDPVKGLKSRLTAETDAKRIALGAAFHPIAAFNKITKRWFDAETDEVKTEVMAARDEVTVEEFLAAKGSKSSDDVEGEGAVEAGQTAAQPEGVSISGGSITKSQKPKKKAAPEPKPEEYQE
jgi:hypothetical protein